MKTKIIQLLLLQFILCNGLSAQIIQTIAGGVGDGGQATNAVLLTPKYVATDRWGNVYVAQSSSNTIRKISPSGLITIFAGTGGSATYSAADERNPAIFAGLNAPAAVACDTAGNVYIADAGNHRLRKVDIYGNIFTIAGNGSSSANGVQATAASLSQPVAIELDTAGNIFYLDANRYVVRRINTSGIVNTVAGTMGSSGFSGDGGAATSAHFSNPAAMTLDHQGNIYIADAGCGRIRKITAAGIITTIAGNGYSGYARDGGPATAANINNAAGLATDATGNLYIGDAGNHLIRIIDTFGIIRRYSGTFTGSGGFSGDGGPDSIARYNTPTSICFDHSGGLLVCDAGNNRIRIVNATHNISTYAGNGYNTTAGYSGDGGAAALSKVENPLAIAIGPAQNIYIADNGNNVIRRINTSGMITTFASIYNPLSIAADRKGNIFVITGNNIQKIKPTGTVSLYAGTSGSGFSGDGGSATNAALYNPKHIVTDKNGNLFIADYNNNRIRKVDTNGIITTVVGTGSGTYYGEGIPATAAMITHPQGMATDNVGNLYITDNNRIRKIDTAGIITTIAGTGGTGATATGASAISIDIPNPQGITVDKNNNIYVYEASACRLFRIDTSGFINLFAGNGSTGYTGDGVIATTSPLTASCGIMADSTGNILIPDNNYNRIRIIYAAGIQVTASPDTICAGMSVTFTATITNAPGIVPSYRWQQNGIIVGSDSSSWSTGTLNNGDLITCSLLDSSSGKVVAISNNFFATVGAYHPYINISSHPSGYVCVGASVNCTAATQYGGSAPVYDWFKNGIQVPGATASSFSFIPANNDIIVCRLHSNMVCRLFDTVSSSPVQITVKDSVLPSITFTASPGDTLCAFNHVMCLVKPTNGSASSIYTWFKNDSVIITGGSYNFIPVNGDMVYCVMSNNGKCAIKDTVFSPVQTFLVNKIDTSTLNIQISPGTSVRIGKEVSCTAIGTFGGTSPVYEWFNNGTLVFTGNPFVYIPAGGDQLYCRFTSNNPCVTAGTVYSPYFYFSVDTTVPNDAGVYPNPNSGDFQLKQTIEGPDGMNVDMSIYSIEGKILYQQALIVKNNLVTADVSPGRTLPEGVYMVSLTYFTGKKSLYFVVKY